MLSSSLSSENPNAFQTVDERGMQDVTTRQKEFRQIHIDLRNYNVVDKHQ